MDRASSEEDDGSKNRVLVGLRLHTVPIRVHENQDDAFIKYLSLRTAIDIAAKTF